MSGRLPVKIYFLFYQKNVRMANIFLREVRPNGHFAPVPPATPGVPWLRGMARSEARAPHFFYWQNTLWDWALHYQQNTQCGLVP